MQNPLSLNPYVYCEDDPVGKVDPDGEYWYYIRIGFLVISAAYSVICAVAAGYSFYVVWKRVRRLRRNVRRWRRIARKLKKRGKWDAAMRIERIANKTERELAYYITLPALAKVAREIYLELGELFGSLEGNVVGLNCKTISKISLGLVIFSFALFFLRKVDFLISFFSPFFFVIFNPLLILIPLIIALCVELVYLFYLFLQKGEIGKGIILKPLLAFFFFLAILFIESHANIGMLKFNSSFLPILKENFYPEAESFKSLLSPYTIPEKNEIWGGIYNLASIQAFLFNYDGEALSGIYGRAYLIQAQSSIGMGRYSEAEYFLKRYSACDSQKIFTNLYQAKLFYHQGKIDEAIKNTQRSINLANRIKSKRKSKVFKGIAENFHFYYKAAKSARKGDFSSCTRFLKRYLTSPSEEVYPDFYLLERLSSDPNFKTYIQSQEFSDLQEFFKKHGFEKTREEEEF